MSLEIIHIESRSEWLQKRDEIRGIGGSDAAAAIGLGKFKSMTQLWQEKTGRVKPKDISGEAYVQFGVTAEGPLRDLFVARHPGYSVEHRPYDIYRQRERPWLFATLDGELTDTASGAKGILEVKTCTVQRWGDWNGRVPDQYYIQVLHQMLATGYSYAWLTALLMRGEDCYIRDYQFDRAECSDDLAELVEREERFMQYVRRDRMPPTPIFLH